MVANVAKVAKSKFLTSKDIKVERVTKVAKVAKSKVLTSKDIKVGSVAKVARVTEVAEVANPRF